MLEGRRSRFEEVGYAVGSCPRAEFAAAHCVNLPTHERVRDPEVLAGRLRALLSSADPALARADFPMTHPQESHP